MIYIYIVKRLKILIKIFYPAYAKTVINENYYETSLGKKNTFKKDLVPLEFKDSANNWVEASILDISKKKKFI